MQMLLFTGRWSKLLSEGAGDEWQAPVGCGNLGQWWSLFNVYKRAFRLQENLLFSIRVLLILDMIGNLLDDIIQ